MNLDDTFLELAEITDEQRSAARREYGTLARRMAADELLSPDEMQKLAKLMAQLKLDRPKLETAMRLIREHEAVTAELAQQPDAEQIGANRAEAVAACATARSELREAERKVAHYDWLGGYRVELIRKEAGLRIGNEDLLGV